VHGFQVFPGDSDASLSTIKAALVRRGHATFDFRYPSKDDVIEGHADSLLKFAAQIAAARKTDPASTSSRAGIALVTHSFGAIVARAALTKSPRLGASADAPPIRCIQFAPPNRGASIARLLDPAALTAALHAAAGVAPAAAAAAGTAAVVEALFAAVARGVLGPHAGMQLATIPAERADAAFGRMPADADTLVVAGNMGRLNPALDVS
jgi:hypothetical protein